MKCFDFQRKKHEQVFKKTFCGMFADQKICKECNHRYPKGFSKVQTQVNSGNITWCKLLTRVCFVRYEREEAFYSLPVTVKNLRLEDSLEQFVNGEILEGDNAYFCEKCNERVCMSSETHVFS